MNFRNVIWTPTVRKKIVKYKSERFTPIETLDYISQIISETKHLLENPIVSKTYTEEHGEYRGISRVVIRKFTIYYKQINDDIVIIGILFPGENKHRKA